MKTICTILALVIAAGTATAQEKPQPPTVAPPAATNPIDPAAPTDNATAAPPPAATSPPPNLSPGASNRIEELRRALQRSVTNRMPRSATGTVAIPTFPTPSIRPAPTPPAPGAQVAPLAAQTAPPGETAAPADAAAGTAATPGVQTSVSAAGDGAEHLLKFNNAPPDQIFEKYAELTGRTVLRPASLPTAAVTIITYSPLTREEAIQALDGALALNNITMINQGDRFVKAVPAAQSIQEGAAISKREVGELDDAEQFVTHVVQLKLVRPSEVAQVFASFTKNPAGIVPIDASQILVLRDFASNIKRMVELIEQVDVPPPESDYKLEVIPIKYGKVLDIYDTMSALISGGGGAGYTSRASQQQRRPGQLPTVGAPGQFGTATGGRYGTTSGRLGRQTGLGQQYGIQQQQQQQQLQPGAQPGAQAGTSFQNRLNAILNRAAGESTVEILGDARIVPDERSNSLIVFANKQDIQMITNIVSKVDVLLAQVLIEGIVLGVALGDEMELGVSWLQTPKQFSDNFAGAGGINNGQQFFDTVTTNLAGQITSGFRYFGKLGDDISVSIAALASDSRVRVLSRPRLQTSHAVPGTFFTGSTVPYVTGFYDYGGYGGSIGSRSTVEQISVGVTLNVTPFITPDGLVVMDIFQDISQLGEFTRIDNNDVPTTTTRNAQATLSVRDGDTIMLGGYIEDSKTEGKSGVPILKDIPGLGALFRSKTHKNSRQELVLLLHVTILKSPADAGAQAEAETAKLPAVFQAEKELKQESQKRLKRAGAPPKQP